jgi:hypothetical protein
MRGKYVKGKEDCGGGWLDGKGEKKKQKERRWGRRKRGKSVNRRKGKWEVEGKRGRKGVEGKGKGV